MCEGSEELKGGKRQDQVSRGEVRKDRCKRGQESLQCCGESGTADNVSCVCKTIGKRVGERNTYMFLFFFLLSLLLQYHSTFGFSVVLVSLTSDRASYFSQGNSLGNSLGGKCGLLLHSSADSKWKSRKTHEISPDSGRFSHSKEEENSPVEKKEKHKMKNK